MANRNRSRIDFFMVSENIVPKITGADIPICKLSTLFDHKPTLVTTRKKNQPRDPNTIKELILDMIPVKFAVEVAVKEFYLNNADLDTIPRYIVNNLRMEFGRVYTRLSAATNLELMVVRENTLNNDTKLQIALYLNEASDILETMPELSFFENLDLIPEPDFFFEGLVLAVKSEVLSKQATIFKTKKFRKLLLTDRIVETANK
jgi:hypothetical protein